MIATVLRLFAMHFSVFDVEPSECADTCRKKKEHTTLVQQMTSANHYTKT